MDQPPPEVLALVVADHVHRDDETTKVSILGTRFVIHARTFPWQHRRLAVYVALTDGHGEVTLRLRLIDADEINDPIAEEAIPVTFETPLDEIDIAFSHRYSLS